MKVAFLDRDGVINEEVGYLSEISRFKYIDGTKQGLQNLRTLGYEIILITNQSGIGRGYYSEERYNILTNYLIQDLRASQIEILDVFYCPHYVGSRDIRYRGPCRCRKPSPGMIEDAVDKFDVDLDVSILVGDKITDVEAGTAAGVSRCFLVESGHALCSENALGVPVFKNLLAVSEMLSRATGKITDE